MSALVSVIIPAYNAARYLAEAIDSVFAQTYRSLELIVVDDGSTDETVAVARSYGTIRAAGRPPLLTLDCQPHRGLSATLNRGFALAHGGFFALLDSDDRWAAEKIEKQMAALDTVAADGVGAHGRRTVPQRRDAPLLDMVFCHVQNFHSPELDAAARASLPIPSEPVAGITKSCMLIRRESFERVGAFDERWQVGDFADWYVRAQERGLRSYVLPETLAYRRAHGANMTIRERHIQGDYARILKASLDRRRGGL